MSSYPAYRVADAIAPYRAYNARVRLLIGAGGMQLPLAYKAPVAGETPRVTSRLFQGKEPTCTVIIEWDGVREKAKPEPVVITASGDFILAMAGAQVDGVQKDTNLEDIIAASGFFVLYSTNRPEDARMPAIWCPWDGRYGSSPLVVPQYIYTPAELGFAQFLPGASTQTTPGNPTLAPAQGDGNQID